MLFLVSVLGGSHSAAAFGAQSTLAKSRRGGRTIKAAHTSDETESGNCKYKNEAAELFQRAREIRASLPAETQEMDQVREAMQSAPRESPWTVPEAGHSGVGYRLYVDIGREDGTWMDPRWGASGKRIGLSIDVKFLSEALANETVVNRMVKDNFGGRSSAVYELESSPFARLRSGFDRMSCHGGGYRIDSGQMGATVRFYVGVDGTPERGSSYGYVQVCWRHVHTILRRFIAQTLFACFVTSDVSVPKGLLYFSLPCFGSSISHLSSKDGPVTVRQIGWHTGWRREESRIVGTFRAVPIEQAQKRDGF